MVQVCLVFHVDQHSKRQERRCSQQQRQSQHHVPAPAPSSMTSAVHAKASLARSRERVVHSQRFGRHSVTVLICHLTCCRICLPICYGEGAKKVFSNRTLAKHSHQCKSMRSKNDEGRTLREQVTHDWNRHASGKLPCKFGLNCYQALKTPYRPKAGPHSQLCCAGLPFQSAAASLHCSVQGGWEATPRSVLDHVLDGNSNTQLQGDHSVVPS